jgi:uncharacterized protein YndB with AHSA1/START domain
MDDIEPIIVSARLGVSREVAFDAFTTGFSAWWPRDYTFSGERLTRLELGREKGADCFEEGPDGFRADWGRIVLIEPPRRLVMTWRLVGSRLESDLAKCSEVEVSFGGEGPQCLMRLFHRNFENLGEAGPASREEMASEQGWPLLIDRFRTYLAGGL